MIPVGFPRFSVLKLTRRRQTEDIKKRVSFNENFNAFIQKCVNNISDFHLQQSNIYLIEERVSRSLRRHVENLLNVSTKTHDPESTSKFSIKRRIYYSRDIELASFIDIDPCCIKVFEKGADYDNNKYELCSIEEDLFNIEPFMHINLGEFENSTLANASIELKVKCGLLNFRSIPSLFQMKQKIKARIKYLNTLEPEPLSCSNTEYRSEYDPCNFFKLVPESVKNEIFNLSSEPQNNIRLFINSFEADPDILKREEQLFNVVTHSIVDSRILFIQVLKLQALAAGQQFIGSAIYSVMRLAEVATTHNPRTKHGYFGSKSNTIENDLISVSKGLYKLTTDTSFENAYKVQHLFQSCGKTLLPKLVRMISASLFYLKNYKVHRKKCSLSIHRFESCLLDCTSVSSLENVKYFKDNSSSIQGPLELENFDKIEALSRKLLRIAHLYKNCRNVTTNIMIKEIKKTYKIALSWIHLYLTGRVAMDLSVIINILYDGDKSIHRISLVDVNVKSMNKIYRWKDDLISLINCKETR